MLKSSIPSLVIRKNPPGSNLLHLSEPTVPPKLDRHPEKRFLLLFWAAREPVFDPTEEDLLVGPSNKLLEDVKVWNIN